LGAARAGGADARKVLAVLGALVSHDYFQKVHSNFDIHSDLMAKLQAG
jgi:hypothetical protein